MKHRAPGGAGDRTTCLGDRDGLRGGSAAPKLVESWGYTDLGEVASMEGSLIGSPV
jgi:hypothetical protein